MFHSSGNTVDRQHNVTASWSAARSRLVLTGARRFPPGYGRGRVPNSGDDRLSCRTMAVVGVTLLWDEGHLWGADISG
jgi:hypothetical protein